MGSSQWMDNSGNNQVHVMKVSELHMDSLGHLVMLILTYELHLISFIKHRSDGNFLIHSLLYSDVAQP